MLWSPLAVVVLEKDEKLFYEKKDPALHLFTALLGGSNSTITSPAAPEEK